MPGDARPAPSVEPALDLPSGVGLKLVALLDVLEVPEHDPALETRGDLSNVVVEAAEARDLSVVDDRSVAHQAHLRPPRDLALGHVGAGDGPHARGPEQLPDLDVADGLLDLLAPRPRLAPSGRRYRPSSTRWEAAARIPSVSLMPATPQWRTWTAAASWGS